MNSKIFVAHGIFTHPLGAECEICEKAKEEYEKWFKENKLCLKHS